MNQLKQWGFSGQWWRGQKGEYWVLAQTILSVGFVLLPVYPVIDVDNLSPLWQSTRWGLMGVCGLIAIVFFLAGSVELGTNLTPLPHPKPDGNLVTTGIYRIVRHPLYSGVVLIAIAYSCWKLSWVHGIAAIFFLLFFDLKAKKEESWLTTKFSDYTEYQSQVKKLIPWLY